MDNTTTDFYINHKIHEKSFSVQTTINSITTGTEFHKLTGYYLCQAGYVIVIVCVSLCLLATLRNERICVKFSGKVGNRPMNK